YEVSSDGGTTWTSTTASQSGLADGDYKFHAIVTDPAGNSSTSNVKIGRASCRERVYRTLAFAGLTDSGTTDTIPVTTDNTFCLSSKCHKYTNVVSLAYEVSSDGGTTWTSTTASQSGLADGDYKFHAIVTDPAGNSSTSNV